MGNRSSSASNSLQVQQLVQMGFTEDAARFALNATNNNFEQAVTLLTEQAAAVPTSAARSSARSGGIDAAREQRLRAAEARLNNNPLSQMRTAAAAGSSGRTNGSNKLTAQQPKQHQSSSAAAKPSKHGDTDEERIQILAQRLAPFPTAVDTLVYAIDTIMKNPGVQKYRELKMTNRHFAKSVGVAGKSAIDFLAAIGFQKSGEWQVLRREDPARLWIGKGALESVKESPRYQTARETLAFQKALAESRESASSEETERRAIFAPLIPIEPAEGAAGTTIVRVFMGDAPYVERRFGSDEKLEKVIYWLGGMYSSLIPGKLESGEWELMNNTLYPRTLFNIEEQREKTLHALELWPSAELRVQVAGTLANSPELS